jgi:hypothetical protein
VTQRVIFAERTSEVALNEQPYPQPSSHPTESLIAVFIRLADISRAARAVKVFTRGTSF